MEKRILRKPHFQRPSWGVGREKTLGREREEPQHRQLENAAFTVPVCQVFSPRQKALGGCRGPGGITLGRGTMSEVPRGGGMGRRLR